MRQGLASVVTELNVAPSNGTMPEETTKSPESENTSEGSPRIAVVIDIGSGVAICDLPYDHTKYDRLVEEFRK